MPCPLRPCHKTHGITQRHLGVRRLAAAFCDPWLGAIKAGEASLAQNQGGSKLPHSQNRSGTRRLILELSRIEVFVRGVYR